MKIAHDRTKRALRVSRTDYTRSILGGFNMTNSVSTPINNTGAELPLDQPTDTLLDKYGVKLYRSTVGSGLYLSRTTRWDTSYTVLQATRTTGKPLNSSPKVGQARFAVPQATPGAQRRLQAWALRTSGIRR